MKLRVLLGIADGGLATSLRGKISELPDVEICGLEQTSGDVAREVAANPGLDAVLIHQELGALPALDLIRDLAMRHPELASVVIADADTTERLLSLAMAAGARGVISRDSTIPELQSRLAAAAEWSRTMRSRHHDSPAAHPSRGRGAMLAFAGAKGGTGTTTLAIQMALAGVTAGNTVCLADLDLQGGDIPSFLDITHRRTILDLVAVADEIDGTMIADTLYVHPAGLHVLLAPAEGERAEYVTARASRQILSALRARYDLVIMDCGTHLADGNVPAIQLSDRILITATPDLPCLRAAKRQARMWERLSVRHAQDLAVVLVKHSKRNEIQPEFARKMVNLPMLQTTVPAAYRALEEAIHTGSPTVPNADYRRAMQQLAAETGGIHEAEGRNGKAGRRRDHGGITVEFAAMVPMFALIFLLIWQLILVGLTSMYASHAANEGARAAAVLGTDSPESMREVRRRAADRVGSPWGDEDHFRVAAEDGFVRTTIDTPAIFPGWRTPIGISAKSKIVYEGG